jgi:acyl-CoA synthetase (NDP forming)
MPAVREERFTAESWERLLRPRSIALVGASPRNEFHSCAIANARQLRYDGRLLPVNPARSEVFGLAAAPTVSALGEPVDMVAISVPARHVAAVVEDALETGVRSFVLHTAGYAETGEEGRAQQRGIVELCRAAKATLIGPNGLGMANLHEGVPTIGTILPADIAPGPIGLIAQSGSAACSLIESGRPLGFSVVASTGNEAVVTAEDLFEVLIEDDGTEVVAMYIESLADGVRFRALMERAHALGKPVVVLKVGATPVAESVMAMHTGRLAVDDRLARAVFRDLGVMTPSDYDEMVELLYLLTRLRGRRVGKRLGILSTSGGELSLVADVADANGLQAPPLDTVTLDGVAAAIGAPDAARIANPFDVAGIPNDQSGETLGETFEPAVREFAADPSIDTVIAVEHMHHTIHDEMLEWYLGSARGIARAAPLAEVPVIGVSVLGLDIHARMRAVLEDAGVPVLRGVRPGLRALAAAARRPRAQETGGPVVDAGVAERWAAGLAGDAPDESDARALLRAAGVPVVEDRLVTNADEAAAAAAGFGYPVVLKVVAPSILHKTDVGGVRLGVGSAGAARSAFAEIVQSVGAVAPDDVRGVLVSPQLPEGVELVIGGLYDETFGPMVMVGLGGVLVEVVEDVAFGLAPLGPGAALELLSGLKGRKLLDGFRGRPSVELAGVAEIVVRVGELIASGALESIEINPLVAGGARAWAVDAKVAVRKGK